MTEQHLGFPPLKTKWLHVFFRFESQTRHGWGDMQRAMRAPASPSEVILRIARVGHDGNYTSAVLLTQPSALALSRDPAFRCRVNATVPSRRS